MTTTTGFRLLASLGVATLVALSGIVEVQGAASSIVSVDVQPGTGPLYAAPAAAPTAGNTWNPYYTSALGTEVSLVASDGSPTSTKFKLNNESSLEFNNGSPYIENALQRDGLATQGATVTFVISGLLSGQTYDLYLYGVSVGSEDQGPLGPFPRATTFSITSQAIADQSTNGLGATDGTSALGSFTLGQDYVLFSGLAPNGSSQITGSFKRKDAGQQEGDFNGFQLVTLPEPATLGLLALAVAGLSLRRQRR